MANNSASGVPKFSSFKPKPKNPTTQVNTEPSNARNDRRSDGERQEVRLGRHRVEKSRSSRRHHHSPPQSPRHVYHHRNAAYDRAERRYEPNTREDRSDRRHHHTASRDDEGRRNQSPPRQSFEDRHDLYMIDVRGDLANLQYGQSNKWNVPLYYLFGSGSVVGHDSDVKIDRQLSNEHGYTLRYPPKKQVAKRAGIVELDEMFKTSAKATMAGGTAHESVEEDFLPLPERKKDDGEIFCPLLSHIRFMTDTLYSSANAHRHAKGIA
jgi:hypothetical protein